MIRDTVVLDVRRLQLATALGIAVVSEIEGRYLLANPDAAPKLVDLFGQPQPE
jgi:hypothetical protein